MPFQMKGFAVQMGTTTMFSVCGEERQTMKHSVYDCPIRAFQDNPKEFNQATPEAIERINSSDIQVFFLIIIDDCYFF